MASLVSWISVTRKELRVVQVDIDHHDRLAQALDVRDAPSLVLLQRGGTVDRLEGRATGTQIAGFLNRHLETARGT
jgi:thioredoxin-like negative regulator of GroEL